MTHMSNFSIRKKFVYFKAKINDSISDYLYQTRYISFDRVTKIWGFLSKVPLVCCWAGFLAAQKSFDRDWQAVEKVFDANSHVHAFNHWVVTEKKFPPKKLIQIHLRRRKAIKIDRKERKAWISSYLGQKSIFLCNGFGSVL